MTARPVHIPHDPEYVNKFYPHEDEHGRYTADQLTAAGERHGDSGEPWHGVDPTANSRHWAAPGTFSITRTETARRTGRDCGPAKSWTDSTNSA